MSPIPDPIQSVPEETARVARAANPKGNPYILFRDELDRIGEDEDFAKLFQEHDLLPLYSWRLALVTILQFRENLTDQQAAEAVQGRINVKYLLGLELTDPGFDFSVLSEYRSHLLQGSAERLLLEQLVERCRPFGLLKTRGKQQVDTDYVLEKIQKLNS